jgi:hypothetical protein
MSFGVGGLPVRFRALEPDGFVPGAGLLNSGADADQAE